MDDDGTNDDSTNDDGTDNVSILVTNGLTDEESNKDNTRLKTAKYFSETLT